MRERVFVLLAAAAAVAVLVPSTSIAADADDLINAVWSMDVKKASELIDRGVYVNGKDSKGTYPLVLACSYKDNDEMIVMLLSQGADPNVRGPNGEIPLSLAAKYSSTAVQMLLDKGADVNAKDSIGWTALRWAQKIDQSEVVGVLEANGAVE